MRFLYAFIVLILLLPNIADAGYVGVPVPLEYEELFLINAMADYWHRNNRDHTGLREYNFDVYGLRGEAKLTHHINILGELGIGSFTIENSNLDLDQNIFWGVGAKLRVFDLKKYQFSFGAGFQARNLDNFDEKKNVDVFYREYEAFLGATFYRFRFMDPYVGVLFSSVSGDIKTDDDERYPIEEDKYAGIYAGFEYRLTPHLDFGCEVRGISTRGLTLFVNYFWRE